MKVPMGAERRATLRGLMALQLGRCCYCGVRVRPVHDDGADPHPLNPTIEHFEPIGRGGRDEERNRGMACAGCNDLKGLLDVVTFLQLRHNPALLERARQMAEGVGAFGETSRDRYGRSTRWRRR